MKEIMELLDVMNRLSIDKYELYDMEGYKIPNSLDEKRLPRWTPVVSMSEANGDGITKVVLDCYERDGHIYSRFKSKDLKDEKVYESFTAPFPVHLFIIGKDNNYEDFCW